MRPFLYQRVDAIDAAVRAASVPAEAHVTSPVQYLSGGTTLIDLMKIDVMRPTTVVDITTIAQPAMSDIQSTSRGLRIGALVTMADAERHDVIAHDYPVLAESLHLAASAQLRNMARLGGNLLQRTRCSYFRDTTWTACNKRNPGSGCAARDGFNRAHAVLGTSTACIASYPGDLAQALMALDAFVETLGPNGPRTLSIAGLHLVPGTTPHIETTLQPGELITAIVVPAGPWTRRSTFVKVRDRESYEFALASAAVALDLDNQQRVREARIGLGGVATTPWRAHEAEERLRGRTIDESSATEAAEVAFATALPLAQNAFKVPLGKATVVRALLKARDMEI